MQLYKKVFDPERHQDEQSYLNVFPQLLLSLLWEKKIIKIIWITKDWVFKVLLNSWLETEIY